MRSTEHLDVERAEVGPWSVAYRERGRGEPVVFVHGFPGPESFDGVVEILSARFRCLVVETFGAGRTRGSAEADPSLPGQAAMLKAFADHLGLEELNLVGNDTGGAIAQVFATSWPDRVRRLVLSDCDAFDNWPPPQIRQLQLLMRIPGGTQLVAATLRIPWITRSRLGLGRLYYDRSRMTADRIRALVRPVSSGREQLRAFRRFFLALDNRYTLDIVDRLRAFKRPTLVIWGGDDDYWTPSWGARLAAEIPGSGRLEVIPFAGLACCEERPDVFARLLDEFFRST